MSAATADGAVDAHAHLLPPAFQRVVEDAAPSDRDRFAHLTAFWDQLSASGLDRWFDEMDAAGVATALVSAPPPGGLAGDDDAGLSRKIDEELLEIAARHPDRLRVLLTLPVSDPERAVRHLADLGAEPLVAGVSVAAHHHDHGLDGPAYESMWRAVGDAGLPASLHPAFDEPPPALRDWMLPTSLDAPFSTSVVAARLMLSGLLDRVPGLTLVVPHLGGTLPYLAQRLVDQSGTGDAEHDVLHYLRHRVLLDSCSFHPPALRCALDTVGPDRLLLGSDHPFRGAVSRAVADVHDVIAEEFRRAVLRDNALRTFRLAGLPAATASAVPA